jgi:hypothetical protein
MNIHVAKSISLLGILMGLLVLPATAQEESSEKNKKATLHVQIISESDGKIERTEKSYPLDDLSDSQRKEFADKILDSINLAEKGHRSLSVTIDDGQDMVITKERKKVIQRERDPREPLAHNRPFKDFYFDWNPREIQDEVAKVYRDIKPELAQFGKGWNEFWPENTSRSSTIRSLSVMPNNPDNGVLTLRFQAPAKGDVNITVTDTRGKEVGKKEIKDFTGDFTGQVELRKNTKGTLFLTVVQNEDGVVKRIVIP